MGYVRAPVRHVMTCLGARWDTTTCSSCSIANDV